MTGHAPFILAAYGVTFAVIGAVVANVVLRYRTLKRALARLGDDAERPTTQASP